MLNLDSKTIAEIKSYNDPPNEVHKVMAGTYILLGESGSKVKVRATKNTFMELFCLDFFSYSFKPYSLRCTRSAGVICW